MPVFLGVEFYLAVVIEPSSDSTLGRNRLDNRKVAVRNAQRFVRCGELNTVPYREIMRHLPANAHAGEPARIVGGKLAAGLFNCEQVF